MGVPVFNELTRAALKVVDWVLTIYHLFYIHVKDAYEKFSGVVDWVLTTFPFDSPIRLLTLFFILFFSLAAFIGLLGGAGVRGAGDGAGTGSFGIGGGSINVGSDSVALGVDKGLNKSFLGMTSTTLKFSINESITTTITLDNDPACGTTADCVSMFPVNTYGYSYCCPPDFGECGGYCVVDCPIECVMECVKHGWVGDEYMCVKQQCKPGTIDYGNCSSQCAAGNCVTSFDQTVWVTPTNNTISNSRTVYMEWV